MEKECANGDCDFLLSVGDNFYLEGVLDAEDSRFQATFEDVYGKTSNKETLKNLDFWQVQGNHDHRGNATAQVVYSEERETSFKMPYFWYSFKIEKSKDLTMTVIMIDTMILMGNRETEQLPNYDTFDYREEHKKWLEKELQACATTYCLVFGHHPVFTIGIHGPSGYLVEWLKPLMEENFVTALYVIF